MGQFNTLLPVLITLIPPAQATGAFFSSHGYFNNSCPVRVCETCGVGQYRFGCVNASSGVCANCTRIPNATFNTHGWFNNSCNFTCNAGFVAGQGRSCDRVIMRYTIDVSATVFIGNNETFNMTAHVRAVSETAGCGACGNVSNSPVVCGGCSIAYSYSTSKDIVFRRLLSSANRVDVNTTIAIDDNRALAESAVSKVTTVSLTDELAKSNIRYDSLSLAAPPQLVTQVIIMAPPPPPPPPVPPPVPPPPPPPSPSEDSNIGAIAGGVVGGVLGLALIIVLVVFLTRQKAQTPAPQTPGGAPQTSTGSIFAYKQAKNQDTPKLASKFVYVRRT